MPYINPGKQPGGGVEAQPATGNVALPSATIDTEALGQRMTCLFPFGRLLTKPPPVNVTVWVPAETPQHVGSEMVIGGITGAPALLYVAVIVQVPPLPLDAGRDQFKGKV
jgi:hypothetical protein